MIINVSAKSLIGFKMRKSFKMLVLVLMLGLLVAVVGCSKPSITKITLSGDDSGVVGGTITLTATIEPTDAKGTLTWESSNTAVATVDNNGVVTLLANGETTITVSCGEVSDSKKITVNDAVKRVSVTGPTVVTVGQEATYIATVEPETANQTVLWSSSDSSVLIVDQTGKAQGVAKGSAVISATAGDLTATFDVTVSEGITIKITGETTVNVGETTKLTATIEPAELAAGKDITWSTSDETTATVSPNGVVTGVKKGKVTITATAGEDNASVEVTVNEVLVTGVTVSGETEIPDGKTLQLTANITPENASNKTVAWSSSDEAKATVDDNGLVTAKGAVGDKVTITATVGTVQGSIELTIIAYAAQPKLDLTCEDYNVANYNVGATMQLNSKYGPTLKRGLYWGTLGITYNAELKQYVVTEKLISGDSTSDTLASCDFTLAYFEEYSQYSTINDGVAVGDIIVLPAGLEHQGKQAGANVALKVFAASDVAFLEDVTLPVAYIGDQPYMTLENALAALQEDQTLELMNYEFGAFAIDKQNVTVKSYSGNAKAIVNDKITIAAETN